MKRSSHQGPQQSKYIFVEEQPKRHDGVEEKLAALTDHVNKMDENITSLLSRILNEVIELRKENLSLKSKVHQMENNVSSIPTKPFENMEDFKNFEKELQSNIEMHSLLVTELRQINCTNSDKFVRICWRKIFVDKIAEQFSWRGTSTKETIRGLSLTLAIRSAFRQKFSLGDEDFDKITQKFFQYAHDRINKLKKYEDSKKGGVE